MRLAIADPPYLGTARMFYGDGGPPLGGAPAGARINPTTGQRRPGAKHKADQHPDAAAWDDPEMHRDLVRRLVADYDGWVIAMMPSNLRHYLEWVPARTRVAVWHDPYVMPSGAHPRRRWEPVLVSVPAGRRRIVDLPGPHVGDVLTVGHVNGRYTTFRGRKPVEWTRWVLAMLGHDPAVDTVDDLFAGSGAVQHVIDQPYLDLGWSG
jgi:hypothetical protein